MGKLDYESAEETLYLATVAMEKYVKDEDISKSFDELLILKDELHNERKKRMALAILYEMQMHDSAYKAAYEKYRDAVVAEDIECVKWDITKDTYVVEDAKGNLVTIDNLQAVWNKINS